MRTIVFGITTCVMLAAAACTRSGWQPGPAPEARAADSTALMQADRDFAVATAQRGPAGWVSFFAEDGAMVGGAGEIAGHDAILRAVTPNFTNPDRRLAWHPVRADVARSRDLGYTVGEFQVLVRSSSGNVDSAAAHGRYLTVWRKQADGSWKVTADIGSNAPS